MRWLVRLAAAKEISPVCAPSAARALARAAGPASRSASTRDRGVRRGDTTRAVADGVAKTARVITAAAAILVDATMVRMILVPAEPTGGALIGSTER
jgi:hypothetical protein